MSYLFEKEIDKNNIPKDIVFVSQELSKNNFESFLVGGCVRDLFLNKTPKDWDMTTNATPEEIIKIFGEDETVYENEFGTVGVKIRNTKSETQEVSKIVEVTTYRKEEEYKDFRRPSGVKWGKSIEEDLKRRDFTMNAIAYDIVNDKIVDIYNGQKDINDKIIKTVGIAEERFGEDALRMLRAIRFSVQLDFVISSETLEAIFKLSKNLSKISKERIRDEFIKIINSKNPMQGIILLEKLNLLEYISPELKNSVGIEQNGHHTFDVFEHSLRALNYAAEKDFSLEIRLAVLFHDIGKPKTRRFDENKKDYTFYGHEVVGERITKKFLESLSFPKNIVEKVSKLVRYHMFFSDPEKITLSSVRRLIVNIGEENIWDLVKLRICDRVGSGTKKEEPYRLRKFESMIEEALRNPVSLKTLKIDGEKIKEILKEKPGKKIGYILHALFYETIEDANKNKEDYLEKRVLELNKLDLKELENLANSGKGKMENLNEIEIGEIKKKFRV